VAEYLQAISSDGERNK